MDLKKILVGMSFLVGANAALAADKVAFNIPTESCRVKFRKAHDPQSKFADFREKLTAGTEAKGIQKKGLVMFKVRDARYKDVIFLSRASCMMGAGASASGGSSEPDTGVDAAVARRRRSNSGVYAKALPLYFTEPLTFAGTGNVKETLSAKNIGAALGLGYDFSGSFFAPAVEVLPLFATSTIKNKGTAKAFVYDGKGLVLGALINVIANFRITDSFLVGPYLPLAVRIESFPKKDVGMISDKSTKLLYGAGLSLKLDFGGVRTGLQLASLGFKSDFLAGLSLELKL